ncbi:MAG: tryptophan synthase subunit alpha [Planctomycetota bacterium]
MTTGLERLASMFARAKEEGRGALMPFVVGGHPEPGSLANILHAIETAGADAVEVGFPFSDPIADGPVVAAAMHEALQRGATPSGVLDEIAEVRGNSGLCLIAMVSVSIVERMGGPSAFVERAAGSGFDGCIFPDIAVEEAEPYASACADAQIGCSLLVAPSTSPERIAQITKLTTGFVYLLARAGITGERSDAPDIEERVRVVRDVTSLPIAVGFGISAAEHVKAVVRDADAAIVGSALVRRLSEHPGDAPAEAGRFVSMLRPGCGREPL